MGLNKLHKTLKKHRELYEIHKKSWDDAQKRIRAATKEGCYPSERVYMDESYKYQVAGNKLLERIMKELEGQEVFPKKKKTVKNKD